MTGRLFEFYAKSDKLWSCIVGPSVEPYKQKLFWFQVQDVIFYAYYLLWNIFYIIRDKFWLDR